MDQYYEKVRKQLKIDKWPPYFHISCSSSTTSAQPHRPTSIQPTVSSKSSSSSSSKVTDSVKASSIAPTSSICSTESSNSFWTSSLSASSAPSASESSSCPSSTTRAAETILKWIPFLIVVTIVTTFAIALLISSGNSNRSNSSNNSNNIHPDLQSTFSSASQTIVWPSNLVDLLQANFVPWNQMPRVDLLRSLPEIRSQIQQRFLIVKQILQQLDPFTIRPIWLLSKDAAKNGFSNTTLSQLQIIGLSRLEISDIALNTETFDMSVLLKSTDIVIHGRLSMTDFNGRSSSSDRPISLLVKNWFTSWSCSIQKAATGDYSQSAFDHRFDDNVSDDNIKNGSENGIRMSLLRTRSYFDDVNMTSVMLNENSFNHASGSGSDLELNVNDYEDHLQIDLLLKKIREDVDKSLASLLNRLLADENLDISLMSVDDPSISTPAKPLKDRLGEISERLTNFINEELLLAGDQNSESSSRQTSVHRRRKRQVPCSRGEELDEYVDSLFRFASRIVRSMEPFALPNATIDLPEYSIKLFLYGGGATRGYTLERKKPAWVYCSNNSVSLGLTVGFQELRLAYKFRAIHDWNLLFDGELEAMLTQPKLQVQFTQTTPDEDSEEQVMQRVDRLRIWRLGRIRIILRGLGNLTQGLGLLLTQFINQNQAQLDPSLRVVEGQAIELINEMLKNITIPFFSII